MVLEVQLPHLSSVSTLQTAHFYILVHEVYGTMRMHMAHKVKCCCEQPSERMKLHSLYHFPLTRRCVGLSHIYPLLHSFLRQTLIHLNTCNPCSRIKSVTSRSSQQMLSILFLNEFWTFHKVEMLSSIHWVQKFLICCRSTKAFVYKWIYWWMVKIDWQTESSSTYFSSPFAAFSFSKTSNCVEIWKNIDRMPLANYVGRCN